MTRRSRKMTSTRRGRCWTSRARSMRNKTSQTKSNSNWQKCLSRSETCPSRQVRLVISLRREHGLSVSPHTEKFDQAITDYTAGLALKTDLLPLSSRQIAEAHYKLSIVLDLTSGCLGDSITHAERALDSVEARLAELRAALSGQGLVHPDPSDHKGDMKGKGKATCPVLLGDDAIVHMTKGQMEVEEKELQGLREDLALKVSAVQIRLLLAASCGFSLLLPPLNGRHCAAQVEELKTSPNEPTESAPALVAKALDQELNVPTAASAAQPSEVRDLTGLVKKKKKNPEANGEPPAAASNSATKRKAEDEAEETQSEKKAKLDETTS